MFQLRDKWRSKLASLVFPFVSLLSVDALAGFSVSGTQLLDGNGQPFVMRGINHPHAWYTHQTGSFADIAATGANTVRVVLSDGQQWNRNSASDVANVISLCKANKLVCVLEVHDVTGSGEKAEAGNLETAAQYWVDIKSALVGEEDYVIINIANEPFGNNVPASRWINGHRDAIATLRNAGLTHTLLIDAANWGQDWQEIMLSNASQVASADPFANTFFSVHMYEVYQDRNRIEGYVSRFLSDHNLPLIVGEFGGDHNGSPVDEDSILSVAEQYGIGYLAWSWSGNGGCCVNLDIVNNFNANSYTPWGDRVVNGVNGIRQTSEIASIYSGVNPTPTPTPTATPTPTPTPTVTPTPTPTPVPTMTPVPTPTPTPTPVPTPPPGNGALCEYVVVNSWNSGFVGAVKITNTTSNTISGWNVSWSFTDGSRVNSSWNANFSGNNPYSASNLSWNANIYPGQTVEFGFVGQGGGAGSAVTGDVCR